MEKVKVPYSGQVACQDWDIYHSFSVLTISPPDSATLSFLLPGLGKESRVASRCVLIRKTQLLCLMEQAGEDAKKKNDEHDNEVPARGDPHMQMGSSTICSVEYETVGAIASRYCSGGKIVFMAAADRGMGIPIRGRLRKASSTP